MVAILNGLAAIKPHSKLTPEAYELWWLSMQDWSLEDFRDAAARLAKTVQFMPTPFDFEQLRKAGRPTAGEAWVTALDSVRTAWTPAGFAGGSSGEPLIDQAVRAIGGYQAIAQCDETKLHYLERRFAEIYDDLQDADDTRRALPSITGHPALEQDERPGLKRLMNDG